MRGYTYFIQCGFVMGSDVRGCVYFIGGDDVMENVTGTIARSSTDGVNVELVDVNSFSEIFASDWEVDNSTGSLSVKGKIHDINACHTTTEVPTGA